MSIDWDRIRIEAAKFGHEWADETSERAEAQPFWEAFLRVFGIERRKVAQFEKQVKRVRGASQRGRIDLFWPRKLLAEHKSAGKDLDAAFLQGAAYFQGIEQDDLPSHVVVSDFARMRLYEVETADFVEFPITQLQHQVQRFAFLLGEQARRRSEQDPVNVRAAERMALLHDELEAAGYQGHQLRVLLVRLLFLLFADDTGLMDVNLGFEDILADHTRKDASDLGPVLARMFQVLDTPVAERQANLPDMYRRLPYVNGELFRERLDMAEFSEGMRKRLLDACELDWGQVSPEIFGSMFQGVMDKAQRRHLGAHYTSEANILKALGALFLDELKATREAARGNRAKLRQFLDMLSKLRFFDPACGSGNFLILAYRELRRLELDALEELLRDGQVLDISTHLRVSVAQFYGLEVDEFAAQIARTAMWLTDHQANVEARRLGQNFPTLPLVRSAHVSYADALETDWLAHLQLEQDAGQVHRLYIVGNPPFVGAKKMTAEQRAQVVREFAGVRDAGVLDYVAAWYVKAARLMNHAARTWPDMQVAAALVSTNSITQGEQVAPLWETVLNDYGQTITFGHRTFKWANDARNNAAVHCVIVGFRPTSQAGKLRRLFTYDTPTSPPAEQRASNLTPYLVDGPTVIVRKAQNPIRDGIPPINFGNMALDGGNLLLTPEERAELVQHEPDAAKYIKPFLDAEDFMSGETRYCLWLVDAEPADLARLKRVRQRIEATRKWRLSRDRPQTQRKAETPALFGEIRHPQGTYVIAPRHGSEQRDYVAFGFLDSGTIASDATLFVPDADLFHFGVMQSRLHRDWLYTIGGRIKSDPRYTKDIVYNTFPWPDRKALKAAQVAAVESAAQAVLDARARHPGSTLGQMYDPLAMPADLRAAHSALDRAVETIYGLKASNTEAQRAALLLTEYQRLAPTLASQTAKPKRTRRA